MQGNGMVGSGRAGYTLVERTSGGCDLTNQALLIPSDTDKVLIMEQLNNQGVLQYLLGLSD